MTKGWKQESVRHGLAKKGIKTERKGIKTGLNADTLPELPDLNTLTKKIENLESEKAKYGMREEEFNELMKQLLTFGIISPSRKAIRLEHNIVRVNRGSTNYDIGYDSGADTYVVFEIKSNLETGDFNVKKHTDIYWEDLKELIK